MSNLFSTSQGTLLKVPSSGSSGIGGIVTIPGLFDDLMLISSGAEVTRCQKVEFQKTLDGTNYGFAFGEDPGRIQITGYAFLTPQSGTQAQAVDTINSFYSKNNVYAKGGQAIEISIGPTSYLGYLEVMAISLQSNQFNFGSFTLSFSTINNS